MTFFQDVRNFLTREKGWSFLFFALLIFYTLALARPQNRTAPSEPSEGIEKLQRAEQRVKDEIRSVGGVRQYLAARPRLFTALNTLTWLLFLAFFLGLGINFFWFTRPGWRQKFRVTESPPEARHWGLSAILKSMVLFILLSLGLNFLLLALKKIFLAEGGSNGILLLHTTLTDFLLIGIVVYLVKRLGGSWRELGFERLNFFRDFRAGLAGYAALLPFFLVTLAGVALAAHFLSFEPPPHPLVEVFLEEEKRTPGLVVYSIFLACVVGPVLEEIFFRGFCYPALKKRWGTGWGLASSSAFFSLIHQNAFAFLPIFVLGLGLGYLYEKRGNLAPSIVLHVVHNSVFIGYFFLVKTVLIGD